MKTVCIVRHGKSSWEDPMLSDMERPLLRRGIERSKAVAKAIRKRGLHFDLLISSPAARALETARIFADVTGLSQGDIRIEEKLYHGGPEAMMDILYSLDDQAATVALFGHNPGMTYLVNDEFGIMTDNLPTSGAACVTYDTGEWNRLPVARHELLFYLTPKNLRS